jgi:hypothetical protein
VVVNETGTLKVQLNGTWNPFPGLVPDRDWVAIFIVRNGQADFAVVEANASVTYILDLGSIPFFCYFALPSTVGFSGGTSSAVVMVTTPDGNTTRVPITTASAGIDLTAAKSVPALATKSVWWNASGNYEASAPVTAPVNFAVVAPVGGLLPFSVQAGRVQQWAGNATFPGARVLTFTPLTAPSGGPLKVFAWTSGSPESGLFVNSSLAPVQGFRGQSVSLDGMAGNRTLAQSTNWSVNTTAVAPRGHDRENCTSAALLQNGSWRLFCTFESVGLFNSTYGVDSAFSPDGQSWSWEAGARYDLCNGSHTFTQLAIVRTLAGGLRMYYGGSEPAILCGLGSVTHISSALSTDEGLTWSLEMEDLGILGVSEPDLRGVVVTSEGWLRMYLNSTTGLVCARSIDGINWAFEAVVSAPQPRAIYLLADGSYKMYTGTTSVTSLRSLDGLSWNAPQTEISPWAGDIEAGPLIDRGDGGLRMTLYSQTDGLFLATLGETPTEPPTIALPGQLSDGQPFAGSPGTASANGSFSRAATIPAGAPLGRFLMAAQAWFGGPPLRGVVLNRAPVWMGPATVAAQEDTPLALDLASWTIEPDPGDTLSFSVSSSFGSLSGATLTLSYPNGVASERINGTVTDGFETRSFTFLVTVTAVNDPPAWLQVPPMGGVTEDLAFLLDLSPFVSDEENATSTLAFSADSPYASVTGSQLRLLYPEGVFNDTFNLTVSDGFSAVAVVVHVDVSAVDDAPTLVGSPPPYYNGSGPVMYQFGATDPDSATGFTFSVVDGPEWVAVSPDGELVIAPPVGQHGRYNYTVYVTDSTGVSSVRRIFVVVLPANRLPVMSPDFSDLAASALLARPLTLYFNVTDGDNDPVLVTVAWEEASQSIVLLHIGGSAWSFEWTPTYPALRPNPFEAWLNGSLALNDSFGVVRYPFAIRALEPPSRPPVINGTIGPIRGAPGETVEVDLTNFMTDPDEFDTTSVLAWTFEGNLSAVADFLYDNVTHKLTFVFKALGNATLVFRLSDPGKLEASQIVLVQGAEPTVPAPGEAGIPWWWALIAAAAGVAGIAAYRRVRGAGAPVAPVRRPFLVEEVFLLYLDGRAIFTRSGIGPDSVPDPELVGSMLVAVQEFVRESMRRGEQMDRMGYGDNVILLTRGAHTELAVTIYGEPDAEFRDMMSETVAKVEGHFAGVVEQWSGNRDDFDGVERLLAPVWQLTAGLTRADVALAATKREVQMISAIEFFQGFVRLKVGVVNNTPKVITGVTVDLDYNGDVLRLHRIEPATYKTSGSKVSLGVIHTGEKATLAYYFDPQVCTTSVIDGSCRFKDEQGHPHVLQMKSRTAEVVCPLFFTPQQANTAMLKRLVETEVREFDVRAYSFAKGAAVTDLQAVFAALKNAVLAHDVQLVRSYEKHHPYFAEAWFYGATQGKGYPVVVRAALDQTKDRAEFFVASVSMRAITGLIAELNHTLHEMPIGGRGGLELAPLFDERTRGEYADAGTVSKMVEGEATPQETDPGPGTEPQKR